MLGNHGRSVATAVFTPVAKVAVRLGITPNMITYGSAVFVAALSFGLLARGYLGIGAVALGVVLFADSIDGVLARHTNGGTRYGAFLDSTVDRITDGMVFGSLLWWAIFGLPEGTLRTTTIAAGIVNMVAIGVVPYTRSRAENFGVIAKLGIAERTDRLVVVLLGAALTGFGLPQVFFPIGMVLVAVGSCVTIIQRMAFTYKELKVPAEDAA